MAVDFAGKRSKIVGFSMIIQWSLFAPGLLLLLLPADLLMSSKIELRSFESFRSLEDSPRCRPWWWVPILWVDPLRGFAGTLLLIQALAVERVKGEFTPILPYALLVTLLGLAVLCQIFTRRDREMALAPMGFVAGLAAALTPWPVALPGLILAFVGLFGLRHFQAFFGAGSAALACLGLALQVEPAWFSPAVGVFVLPIVATFLTGRALALPTHRADAVRRPAKLPA